MLIIEKFYAIRRIITICATICGANVINPQYRMNCVTWYLVIAIKVFFVFTGYTTYVSYSKEGDWTLILQNLCTVGTAVQGYSKLVNLLVQRPKYVFIFTILEDIYKEYQHKHRVYQEHLNRSLLTIKKVVTAMAWLYFGTAFAVSMCPVYYYFFHNKRLLVLQILFPGLDPDTNVGYFTLNGIHLSCVFFATFGNFAGDMFTIVPLCSMPLFKDILISKFHAINEKLLKESVNRQDTMEDLKGVIQWHQKYLEYMDTCRSGSNWVLLVQVGTTWLSVAMTIICVILKKWPAGPLYLLYMYIAMNVFCGLGTLADSTNEAFVDACCNELLWYKFSVPEQKMLRTMLMMAQKVKGISVGGFAPLNMNMGLQVSKAIYSWTMMFVNFLYSD